MLNLISSYLLIIFLFILLSGNILSLFNPSFLQSLPISWFISGFLLGFLITVFFHFIYSVLKKISFLKQPLSHCTLDLSMGYITAAAGISSLIAGFLLFIQYQPAEDPFDPEMAPSLIVLGLDGATWDIINPMIDAGELPVIQRLMKNGSYGTLQSLEPMSSPSLWTSISTGLPSEEHGVTGFFSTRSDLKAPRVWDICHSHHYSVGLFSWLVTWQILDPFEFIIPAWMARSPETIPSAYSCWQEVNLEQDLYERYCPWKSLYKCAFQGATARSLDHMLRFYIKDAFSGMSEEDRFARKLLAEVDLQTDIFLHLLRNHPVDITTFILYGSDKLAHRFWHSMSPEEFNLKQDQDTSQFASVIQDYYKKADQSFGRILQALPDSTHVILLSDHGMRADTAMPRQYFPDIPALLDILSAAHLFHYTSIQREDILIPRNAEPGEIMKIQNLLEAATFSDSEEPVFIVNQADNGNLHLRTNFSLTWHEESPLNTHEMIVVDGKQHPVEDIFVLRTFSGNHDPEGIIILSGPAFQSGKCLDTERKPPHQNTRSGETGHLIDLLDVAPTILYLLDLPISQELPGEVIREAFKAEFLHQYSPVLVERYPPLDQLQFPDDEIPAPFLERLQSVGYVE